MRHDVDRYREKRKALIARRYSARLMNNTKWREVFAILSQAGAFVEVTWIEGHTETSYMPIPERLINELGLGDPGIGGEGGPFFYEEIETLVVRELVKIGKWHDASNDLEKIQKQLLTLGELPVARTTGAMTIHGYQLRDA